MSSMTRINAELFERPLSFPAEVTNYPDFIANQTSLYHRRRQALQDQVSSLTGMQALARRELDMNQPLLETGEDTNTRTF